MSVHIVDDISQTTVSYLHVICTRHEGVVVKRAKKYSTNLSHKSDPVDRWYMQEYCSLFNGFSTEGLRAYRRRFSGNEASKYTKNHLFHCWNMRSWG